MSCEPQELALGFQLSSVTSLVPWALVISQHPEEGKLSARRRALGRDGEEEGLPWSWPPRDLPSSTPRGPAFTSAGHSALCLGSARLYLHHVKFVICF